MVDPPWVEARLPGALRCGASTMQLERREAIELVLSFRASLLSEVAARLSIWLPVIGAGSESKTNEVGKSYKKNLGLWISNTVAGRVVTVNRLCMSYWTYIQVFIQVRIRLALLCRDEI